MTDFLGIVAIVFFYLLILVVGVWAGRKSKDMKDLNEGEQTEEVRSAGFLGYGNSLGSLSLSEKGENSTSYHI